MSNLFSSKAFVIVVIFLLLASDVFFAAQYVNAQRQLRETQVQLEDQRINERTLAFTQLFIEKVLKSETEIDFETRLQLENAVRGIGDEEILAQWQRFTESVNEKDAQQEVKNLLSLLVRKVGM
ncbi:MAG: hypothetical protein A3J30_03315 [Candidatus Wildermuthbacteria bacterium RIFCSPLOWO2_02_FULL_47_9c]|uniref:Uncharacterized protein n=2 Tax=Parcubacteria group TaxID=1794811 RepID=A0A837IS44_9BACT|nr:MAG: hypothetical protein UY25_C0006G0040 [Candidatus Yanofskybacteria bacterium GW2011_GWC1_48_11]KKW03404.1 MAG: hypothetical protein UY38_C0004G0030 [Parcubacteria group bacterium GW2011_GWB1_49_12]KKW08272.1 MAG: hypothetical protein UY45_C0010G0007 [Parcubacteria group bacterium GW2011_GWA1_49_26]KKW13152.1 MAG: hypothetical protein UY53_C0017G0002 [Parcubacteria group bacterium GW2011_GWA2_50_10]OHA61693.1 MAG: hypothetical protein A2109_01980 [Candidatus Wildermuthbacteria bacterium G